MFKAVHRPSNGCAADGVHAIHVAQLVGSGHCGQVTLNPTVGPPRRANVPYSGPPYRESTRNGPSPTSTIRLQRTTQPKQVPSLFTMVSAIFSPLIASAPSNVPLAQLRVGRPADPGLAKDKDRRPEPSESRDTRGLQLLTPHLAKARTASGSADKGGVRPRTAIALRFLAAITVHASAPVDTVRVADQCAVQHTPFARRPTLQDVNPLIPQLLTDRVFDLGSETTPSREASRNSASPSCSHRYTGCGARPRMTMPSRPAYLS